MGDFEVESKVEKLLDRMLLDEDTECVVIYDAQIESQAAKWTIFDDMEPTTHIDINFV